MVLENTPLKRFRNWFGLERNILVMLTMIIIVGMGEETMVMGDFVLLENEINTVISTLAEANISVTALHNHFVGEQPRIMFMHVHGMGDAKALAQGFRNALNKTATPKSSPASNISPPALNTKHIEQIMGCQGRTGGIDVVAVHNHMLDEEPRIFFLHYWGTGAIDTLAQTVRAAFDQAKGPVR